MGVRRAVLVAALVGAVQVASGLPASPVTAAAGCAAPQAIFAVSGATGHLVELASCPDAITEVAEVDTGDWRTSSRIFATGDETVTVVYRVTADGGLEARRQPASGAPLEAPVEVGAGIDWSAFRTVVVPRRGYLWADDGEVRAFRHDGWATGGTAVVEGPVAFASRGGQPATGEMVLTGMGPTGVAEAIHGNRHVRVWREGTDSLSAWYSGGIEPGATGTESRLFGVTWYGSVASYTQPPDTSPDNVNCPVNSLPWQVSTSLPGDWSALAVPQRLATGGDWPVVPAQIPASPKYPIKCPYGVEEPYQWQ
jgi:hypothetical protein